MQKISIQKWNFVGILNVYVLNSVKTNLPVGASDGDPVHQEVPVQVLPAG